MSEKLNRFTSLMKNIFELDKSDLDFGIYRIMNIRKAEIEKFLSDGLPHKVQETLAPFASNTGDIEKRIAEIEKICSEVGVEVTSSKMAEEYATLKSQLAGGVDMSALETDVYSALYSFFNRYYDEGDFLSKRRYKEGVYAIPYEGEEVKLYWANHDQYYIKTAENFKDYTFKDGDRTVHFRLVDATTEQNNNKESDASKRTFMLWEESEEYPDIKTIEVNGNEMIIRFVFDVPENKKKKYAEENYQKISAAITSKYKDWFPLLSTIATNNPKKTKTLLEKHLEAYVAKNTFDYFIHKDLHGFLLRELDFYIKSEIIHLDDIDTVNEKRVGTYLAKVKAIKRVGKIIIDFLAQIENFQKKLWLKKKFVVSTDWCITLDKIDADFFPEIIGNKAQVQEWIDMYAINEVDSASSIEGWSNPPTIEFLRQNKNLLVDTKHFTLDFKDRLIASIDKLDEETNGLMIHSDNFQALNLLTTKFNNRIPLIYIDPPYNTDASKILYKNGYEHSSWMSLMHSRLEKAKSLLSDKGIIQVAIDDYEFRYLNCCMDAVFGSSNAISNIAIFTNPKGRDQGFIAQAHDYTVIYAKNKERAETNNFVLTEEEVNRKFSKSNGEASVRELPLKRTGTGKRREERPYMYFPFLYDPNEKKLHVVSEDEYKQIFDPQTDTFDDDFVLALQKKYESQGWYFMLPLSNAGEKLRWRWGYKSCVKGVKNGTLFAKALRTGEFAVYQYDFADNEATPKSMWIGEKYDASSKGTNILENILPNNPFDYPKSLYTVEDNIIIGSHEQDLILDFFAGSATTGHAVLDLNRNIEESQRKYILIDMGEYFYSVTKARMKKVVYSAEWRNGKPQNRTSGCSQIIKYCQVESYEDALSNVVLSEEKHQMARLFGDDYLINYMLNVEAEGSILNLDLFKTPFNYKMKINENNETKDKTVDLVETFNYLLGLAVVRQSVIAYFKAERDDKGNYEGAVHLLKDIDGEYAFKQIEGTLPDGRRALIIWRTITNDLIASNAALDAYFAKHRINPADREFDIIYVNGDNNLENMKAEDESWKVNMIEIEFKNRMFEEA
jgi:adenine-specific DNA-methyltransferase